MRALHKRLVEQGIDTIDANTSHPGMARTNLGESDQRPLLMKLVFAAAIPSMSSPQKGAQPTIYAATSPEVEGLSDRYFGPKGQEKVSERYYSSENEQTVWDYCMKVVGPYLN